MTDDLDEPPARELTDDEVRDMVLDHIMALVHHWHAESRRPDALDKLTGLVHSIFAMIDGASGLPAFLLAPMPHEEDQAFRESEGEDWFPSGPEHDIGGALHEHWGERCRHLDQQMGKSVQKDG